VVREVTIGGEDAGHCVTAFFDDADIDAEGHCLNLPTEEVLKRHQKEIIMALAGFAAEKQEFPTVNRGRQAGRAEGDIEKMRFNAEQLARCGVQFDATPAGGLPWEEYCLRLRPRAELLVKAHRKQIMHVAEALFKERRLAGDQVRELMVAAAG